MNLEQDLAEALHGAYGSARPSADLRARILSGGRAAPARTAMRGRVGFGLAGIAAVLLVVALLPSLAVPAATAPARTMSAPPTALAHHSRGDISFDYPASWTFTDGLGVTSDVDLWTGFAPAACAAPDSILASIPVDAVCGRDYMLSPGMVVVDVYKYFVGVPLTVVDPSDLAALASGETYTTVGGLPAVFSDEPTPSGAAEMLDWTLSAPRQPDYRLGIHAEFRGPGADRIRSDVESMVASIRYNSSIQALAPSAGAPVAAGWLARLRASDPAYACFPDVPGTTHTASVTVLPFAQPLTEPLQVSCTMEVEPTAIGLWKVTLTATWRTSTGGATGVDTMVGWVAPDGTQYALQPAQDPLAPVQPVPSAP
jgi:hypothetical protein